ncbi:MAG: hypothetical protein MH472_10340 [Bacteroidia bacterium]|nr:hypothetical protein [Bacteroidia bacterium]
MRKLKSILFALISWFGFSSFEPNWQLLFRIEAEAKIIETDRMGNIYLVSKTNQLYKYNAKGELLSTLNYAYLGNITHLDAGNPLEIYLFYKELNALVFLDNNLAFRGKMSLSDAEVIQASAAARSYENGIWVFDQGDLQLKKLQKDGNISQRSGNALQFTVNKNLHPTQIIDTGTKIYLNDSSEGVMVFDIFANYIKTIPIKGKTEIRVLDEQIFYLDQAKLISYQTKLFKRDTISLPEPNVLQFGLEKEKLFLLNKGNLAVYSYSGR